jgi:tetratricopeptide (TPR) repeat protein
MCLGLALAMPAWAQTEQHDHSPKGGAIKAGTVNFETSCSPAVKDEFNLAVAELHSFWFPEARSLFQGIATKDPTCAMAHWGVALTYWGNPFAGQRSAQTIANGKAAIDKARSTGTPTAREKGFIDAVAGLFSSADVTTQRARVVAYEGATELVASQNRNDMEARIFWALAIAQTALPTDKTFAQNLKAAEILEPLYKRNQNHPGLAHYIIHAYDVPALAAKALPAARAYADIAPSVPHALHMPSHTFTRVGEWKESVATNIRSADEAEKSGGGLGEGLHARDYMTYAYLQMGMDKEARGVLDHAMMVAAKVAAAPGAADAGGANTFALAAIPARYAMERGQWAEATALKPWPAANTPYTEAITHFARAIGFARSGKPAEAAADIARLTALRDREIEMKDAYWTEQVDIQRRGAAAWVMFAEGKQAEAIAAMSAVAEAEDKTDKAAVTPGPIAPAREMYGAMLLEAGRAREALVAFEAVAKKEPNRFLALYGAGKAAEATKQTAKAKGYYKQIVATCADAGTERPELQYARKMAK